jgi:hypothetical protein
LVAIQPQLFLSSPPMLTKGAPVRLRSLVPLFLIVKVRVVFPASIANHTKEGVIRGDASSSPSTISTPLPKTWISGAAIATGASKRTAAKTERETTRERKIIMGKTNHKPISIKPGIVLLR